MFILSFLSISTVILTPELVQAKIFYNVFSVKNCGTKSLILLDYESLEIASWLQQNSKCIRSDLERRTPAAFPYYCGCLALTVHLRIYSDTGELKITLFNDSHPKAISNFPQYNKKYYKGWNENVLNVEDVRKYLISYSHSSISDQKHRLNQDQTQNPIQNLGQSRNNLDQDQKSLKLNQSQSSIPDQNQRLHQNRNKIQDLNLDPNEIPHLYQSQNLNLDHSSNQNQDENSSLKLTQNHTLNPDENQSTNIDQNSNQNQDQSSNDEQSFWNPFTISLVTIVTSVVIAVCLVSAYHLGKIRGRDSSPVIGDDVQPSRIIPRVKRPRPNPLYNGIIKV